MKNHDISVLMCVYNTREEYLRTAIESILNQTYPNFEFIIVLDHPTDNSEAIIEEYASKDHRIRIIRNPENYGLTKSLNIGLRAAGGKYIARMDSDDISLPERFEKQFAYMEAHPDVVALGSRVCTLNQNILVMHDCPADHEVFRIRMLFRNFGIPHPTAFIRHETLQNNNVTYDESIKKSQDYKLWVDLMPYGNIIMHPEVLLLYRIHKNQISMERSSQLSYSRQISIVQAVSFLGALTETEKELHVTMSESILPGNDVQGLNAYINRILLKNKEQQFYNHTKLKRELRYMWCQKAWRRILSEKKYDMLFHAKTLSMLSPRMVLYLWQNKKQKADYQKAIQASGHYKGTK